MKAPEHAPLHLLPLAPSDLPAFRRDMQEAFQRGAEAEFGACPEILPASHIERSLTAPGAAAFKAVCAASGEMLGGAVIVVPQEATAAYHLDFLYVKQGAQGRGVGQFIWHQLEARYPEATLWETHTPYFEKRNIHFYVNRCGFHIVEFFHPGHPEPHMAEWNAAHADEAPHDMPGGDYFLRFEKRRPSPTLGERATC